METTPKHTPKQTPAPTTEALKMPSDRKDNTKSNDAKDFGTKKQYRYPMIKLYLNQEREAKLKQACLCAGVDPRWIDSRSQDAVWALVDWVIPLLEFRNKVKDIVRQLGFKDIDLK